MIRIEDLDFAYRDGDFRLVIPHLEIAAGERVAVVGPSGSGKTTLLNLLAGIAVPHAGRIAVGDVTVNALSDAERRGFRARHIGFVFQDFALVAYLSAWENILYPYRITPQLKIDPEVRARAEHLAVACGLVDRLAYRPATLSQGECQRVAIARALVTQPQLVLADEPTGNLDPANKRRILDVLFERAAEIEASIVAVTHDHALLDAFDRVIDFTDIVTEAQS